MLSYQKTIEDICDDKYWVCSGQVVDAVRELKFEYEQEVKANSRLRAANKELQKKIIESEVESKDKQIKELEEALAQRNARVAQLEQIVSESREQNAPNLNKILQLESRIAELEKDNFTLNEQLIRAENNAKKYMEKVNDIKAVVEDW